jgi:hypothetical protein
MVSWAPSRAGVFPSPRQAEKVAEDAVVDVADQAVARLGVAPAGLVDEADVRRRVAHDHHP